MEKNTLIFVTVYLLALVAFAGALIHSTNIVKAEKEGRLVTCSMVGDYDKAQEYWALYKSDHKKYSRYAHLNGNPNINDEACELLKIRK